MPFVESWNQSVSISNILHYIFHDSTNSIVDPITFKLLRGYFYCDNLCTSVDTTEEVDELITQATAIFAAAKFEL